MAGSQLVLHNRDDANQEIKDIKIDHRLVEDGDLYIAMRGRNYDGNLFADEAIKNGAEIKTHKP